MSFVIQQQQRIFGLSDLATTLAPQQQKKNPSLNHHTVVGIGGEKVWFPGRTDPLFFFDHPISSPVRAGSVHFSPASLPPPSPVAFERERAEGGGAGQLFNYMLLSAGGRGIALPQTRRTKYSWQPSRDKGRRFSERKAEWAEGGRVE